MATLFKDIYEHYACDHGLNDDYVQQQAVKCLDHLYTKLVIPPKKSWLSKTKSIKGLYLWGGVGRGKTMIMDLFYNSLPREDKKRVHFNAFMLGVHNSITLLRKEGKGLDPLKTIAKDIAEKIKILCFDEFQVYDIADAMVLSELFTHLFNNGVTVIATSNVAPDNLYKDGLQRARFEPFIPLVHKHMDVFHLDSPTDYRQQALRENGVYFISDEEKMNKLFGTLTTPDQTNSVKIDIQGRDLPIIKATADTAWVTFNELCEKPRAAIDYQTLAKHFKTIFINNVPCMEYDRRNELKRFILLIDTLYDEKIRLIMNAEDTPTKLYNGEDHAFEFERTISRLLEMQGEDYLNAFNMAQDIDD